MAVSKEDVACSLSQSILNLQNPFPRKLEENNCMQQEHIKLNWPRRIPVTFILSQNSNQY